MNVTSKGSLGKGTLISVALKAVPCYPFQKKGKYPKNAKKIFVTDIHGNHKM